MRKKILTPGNIYKNGLIYKGNVIPPHYLFKMDALINFGLINREDDASEEDISEAISFLIAKGCSKPLIRLGKDCDGGYLVPNDLENIDACFSPGVGSKIDLENSLAENYGIHSYSCDFDVDLTDIDHNPDFISFRKGFLGSYDYGVFITLDTWVKESNHSESQNLLLQMDIEGSEYSSLLAVSESILKGSE